jgi:hypothetical protein
LLACHLCDVPKCVNPDHLFLGTTEENTADRHAKGRDARGERVGSGRLTPNIIKAIRLRYEMGETQVSIAADLGLSQPHVSTIVRRRGWKHVV